MFKNHAWTSPRRIAPSEATIFTNRKTYSIIPKIAVYQIWKELSIYLNEIKWMTGLGCKSTPTTYPKPFTTSSETQKVDWILPHERKKKLMKKNSSPRKA